MVVIPPIDAQSGEAVWRLVTGAAQDSWEAICKHSHPQSQPPSAAPELRPRRGGGGENHNARRAEIGSGHGHGGSGSGSNYNYNNNSNNDDDDDDDDDSDDSNNLGSSGKITTVDTDMLTALAADLTTAVAAVPKITATATAKGAAKTTSTTPAAAATTTQAAETTTAEAAAAATAAAADATTTPVAAAAATTTADAATPTVANDSNDTAAAAATDNAAAATDTAAAVATDTPATVATAAAATDTPAAAAAAATSAAQAQVATDGAAAATQAAGDTATAAAVVAATQAAGADAGSETAYANANGQTATRHVAATTTADATTGTLGTAAATGTSASTTPSGSHASNIGLIIGVVVGAVALLAVAFVLYRFRRSKYLKALCCCGFGGSRNAQSDGSGYDRSDGPTSTRHMADSNARLVGRTSADSLLTPMSGSAPVSALSMARDRDEKRGYSDTPSGYYGSNSRAAFHDDEKRGMAYAASNGTRDLTPPPPVSMAAVPQSPTSPITPVSASSSSSASSSAAATPAAAPAHKPAHRQRSSYSTFPLATRAHNYSNSITRVPTVALPAPPSTAVHQRKNSVPRVAVQAAAAELPASHTTESPSTEQPVQRMSGLARSSLALSITAPEGLVPPPRNLTTRQRQSSASHDDTDADDSASLAPTFSRSSYTESIGGESITSSVLMSPSLLQWPVPPNTPPLLHFGPDAGRALGASNLGSGAVTASGRSKSQESIESGSTDTNSQGSGPLFDRVAIVPSHVPRVVSVGNLPVPRRPLTTVSSASSPTLGQAQVETQVQAQAPLMPMPGRGPMPTRASLSGPSSRNLMQMQSARRPSVASSGSSHGNGSGSGSIVQAVSGPPPSRAPYPPYAYSQQSPRGTPRSPRSPPGLPTYHQQQYPHPQRLPPTGYTPPHASAVTVHHTGQATSVRVPIARSQQRH